MAASSDEPRDPVPSCPDCGMAVAPGQRRCTNCGASVELRRRLPRRTPLIAALTVAALGGGAVVVAQAAVTEQASIDASAPADAASAPISVAGASPPPASKPTSTAPKVEVPPTSTTPTLDIPSVDEDLLDQAAEAREEAAEANSKDGEPVDDDTAADPDDLGAVKTVKVVKAINYEPVDRPGVEFGKPKAAIDKRSRTVWDVTVPADGQPFNVGIVLDLGDESRRVSAIKLGTPTPGFGVQLYRTDDEQVPDQLDDWKKVGEPATVSDDLTLQLTDGDPKWARYILVYLTTPVTAEDTRAAISNLEVLP